MSNTIVSSTTTSAPTGLGTQKHTIYDGTRWWHFYWASATSIGSEYSTDGATWTAGASLTVTSGENDGRDLSATFKVIASTNVVHLTWGNSSGAPQHVRATISGTTLTWGSSASAATAGNAQNEPQGFGVAVGSDGKVWNACAESGDTNVVQSTNADTAASWTNGFNTASVLWVVTTNVTTVDHNRPLIAYGASGKILGMGGDAATSSNDNQLYYNVYSGTAWGTEASTGFTSQSQDTNDWAICRLSDTDFHCVRRTSSGFEHRRFNGTSWSAGSSFSSPPTSKTGSGLALVSDGTSVWLIIIDSGAANAVKYSKWTSGSGWGAWTTLESTSATRNYIGCSEQQDSSSNWLVYWTEGSASPWAINGILLSTSSSTHSLTTQTRAKFVTAIAMKEQARAKFLSAIVMKEQARAKFLSRMVLKEQAHATFVIAKALKAATQAKFAIAKALKTPTRAQFVIAKRIMEQARAKFLTRTGLTTQTRSKFSIRTALDTLARSTFKILASGTKALTTTARAKFVTRMVLDMPSRAKFATRRTQTQQARARFAIRFSLTSRARARFYTRVALLAQARARFLTRIVAQLQARSRFVVRQVLTTLARSKFLIFFTGRSLPLVPTRNLWVVLLSATGNAAVAKLSAVANGAVAKLTATRGNEVVTPFTSIQSPITVKDSAGNPVTNLSVLTLSLTFPDGTTSSLSLGSGILNSGAGVYTASYTTKDMGSITEDWAMTAADGVTLARVRFLVPVTYQGV